MSPYCGLGLTLALYLLGIASLKDYYELFFDEEHNYFYVSALIFWPLVELTSILYVAYHNLFEKE